MSLRLIIYQLIDIQFIILYYGERHQIIICKSVATIYTFRTTPDILDASSLNFFTSLFPIINNQFVGIVHMYVIHKDST